MGCEHVKQHLRLRCGLTSSLACLDQARLHTWDPVSVLCRAWPVSVFQKRRQRSAVPPPDASSPCWWGDQAMALTAARWSLYCCTGRRLELFHTSNCRKKSLGAVSFSAAACFLLLIKLPHLVVVAPRGQVLVVRWPLEAAHFLPVTLQPPLCRGGRPDVPLQDHSVPATRRQLFSVPRESTCRQTGWANQTLRFTPAAPVKLLNAADWPTRAEWPSKLVSFLPPAASQIWT